MSTGSSESATADESFVPRANTSVASVEVDGERVLYDTETGQLHRLDAVGSLIWVCFDGRTQIGELAVDLADAFAIDVERVMADVSELVRTLSELGLLAEPGDSGGTDTDSVKEADERAQPSFLVDPPGG